MSGRKVSIDRRIELNGAIANRSQSSARNYMTYHLGTKESYDMWAREVCDKSYELSNFMPYFQKSVAFTPVDSERRASNASYNPKPFAQGSPLQVTVPLWANPFSTFIKKALESMGFKEAADFVSGTLSGVQYNMVTTDAKDQTRSTSGAFIREIGVNEKFIVYKNSLAQKVLFNRRKKATGVSVTTDGKSYTLRARNEVIVSAGAVSNAIIPFVSPEHR